MLEPKQATFECTYHKSSLYLRSCAPFLIAAFLSNLQFHQTCQAPFATSTYTPSEMALPLKVLHFDPLRFLLTCFLKSAHYDILSSKKVNNILALIASSCVNS